jgi:cytochrome c-type biogenesis protein CcmH
VRRALAALLALTALAVAAGSAPAAGGGDRSWTVAGISTELMCPICKTRLDMSQSPAADQIRNFLRKAKSRGLTRQQVKDELVASYGTDVLADTPRHGFGLLAWLAPAAVLLGGIAAVVLIARRWAARRSLTPALAPAGTPPEERDRLERRLEAELDRFEE